MGWSKFIIDPIRQMLKGTPLEGIPPTYILIAILLILKYVRNKYRVPVMEEYEGHKVVSVPDKETYDKIKKDEKLVLVDFFANWCPPCKAASPIFGKWSTEWEGITFVKVDVDVARDVAQAEGIRSMPTFKIYKDNKMEYECSGFKQDELLAKIKELGAEKTVKETKYKLKKNE